MSGQPSREVAKRLFARELDDSTFRFEEGDDDRAPVYSLLPTGEKANRVYMVGSATEVQDVGEDGEYWQLRAVDPAGNPFFAYAGQYQPEAAATIRNLDTPQFVAVVGKPRTYETDDGDINVSLRPEEVNVVDETTRNRFAIEAAEKTLDRIEAVRDGVLDEYIEMADEEYDVDLEPYQQAAIEALEDVDEKVNSPATAD